MEVARQLENEEAVLSHSRDDREGSRESDRDDDRERIRKGGSFERERKESNRYSPYPTSKSDRERAKKSSSRKENRVYVSNLPFSIKWQDLKDHMKKGIYDSSVSCFCLVYCPVAWVNYRLSLSYVRLLLSSFLLKEKSWLCCVVGDVVFAEILEDSSGKSKVSLVPWRGHHFGLCGTLLLPARLQAILYCSTYTSRINSRYFRYLYLVLVICCVYILQTSDWNVFLNWIWKCVISGPPVYET